MTTNDLKTSLPLPPGNLGMPIIGETIKFLTDANFMKKRQEKYGKIFKTNIFGNPTIVAIGAEAMRFILTNENLYFSSSWPYSTKTLLGDSSLSVQQGSEHQSRRKLMSHAFQPQALANYFVIMQPIILNYLKKWEDLGNFTWHPELRDLTFDIASSVFVGSDPGAQTGLSQVFEEWCNGLFTIPITLPWTKFGKALKAREKLINHIEKMVLMRQKETVFGNDALGLLLQARDEEGNGLSLAELKDQVLTLLFAGHETVTSALSSLCLFLAQNPKMRERLQQEQKEIVVEGILTMEHLKLMNYLDQVIKEVLRMLPPVGGGFRKVIKSCEFNGYYIPEGWLTLYQISETHQDEYIYANPKDFDPDRFGIERAEDKQKPFSFVAYSGGARECLGKAFAQIVLKGVAAHLIRNYTWELLPNQNLEIARIPTPHPRDGLKVSFRRL